MQSCTVVCGRTSGSHAIHSLVRIFGWQVAFVVVDSAAVAAAAYWALADALLTLLTDAGVQELTVVAALHLPYAKQAAVYHASLNTGADRRHAHFPPVDAAWALKDRFLAALVHLLKVEQAPRTHFLLAKGHKPGRDHAGTYEVRANDLQWVSVWWMCHHF